MNRVFGRKKAQNEAPTVNITDIGGKVDARITDLDMKVQYFVFLGSHLNSQNCIHRFKSLIKSCENRRNK
jgi:hypothetical protein